MRFPTIPLIYFAIASRIAPLGIAVNQTNQPSIGQPEPVPTAPVDERSRPDRTIAWVLDIYRSDRRVFGALQPGDFRQAIHSSLWFGPMGAENPPFRVELISNVDHFDDLENGGYVLRGTVLSWDGNEDTWIPVRGLNGGQRRIYQSRARVTVTNAALIDRRTGKGLVHDVWAEDQRAVHRGEGFYDCNSFARQLYRHLRPFGAQAFHGIELSWRVRAGERWNQFRPNRPAHDRIHIETIFLEYEPANPSEDVTIRRRVWYLPSDDHMIEEPPELVSDAQVRQPVSYLDEWGDIPEVVREDLDIHPLPVWAHSLDQAPPPFASLDRARTAMEIDDSESSASADGFT